MLPAAVYKVESRNAAIKQKEQSLRHFAHFVETVPPGSRRQVLCIPDILRGRG